MHASQSEADASNDNGGEKVGENEGSHDSYRTLVDFPFDKALHPLIPLSPRTTWEGRASESDSEVASNSFANVPLGARLYFGVTQPRYLYYSHVFQVTQVSQ